MAASVKTYQGLIEVDTVSHIFKNVSFEDVGEMEVSSSITHTDSSLSSSGSHSCSPFHEYVSRRPRYYNRSHSQSRSLNRCDRGYAPRYEKLRLQRLLW